MNISDAKHLYFIGIGGIGMSALARYFLAEGKKISGYDRVRSELTMELESEGMSIHYDDDVLLIPQDIDAVIYTPAIPSDHREFNHLKSTEIPMMKRAEALGEISHGMKTIAVAGTHGKTTTSSMTVHVLKKCGFDITAFLGGVVEDYESNFLLGESEVAVVEADEYDRSFLHLSPWIASVSAMEPDHLDIYGDSLAMEEGFRAFAARVRDGGYLIIRYGLLDKFSEEEKDDLIKRDVTILEYGDKTKGEIQMPGYRAGGGKFSFDYLGLGHEMKDVELSMPGLYNAWNASVAITVALILGGKEDKIREALSGFKGIHRRFEKIIDRSDMVYIDDYAHHPGELKAVIHAVRDMYPGKWITGIFQPHLYSRTQDFADEFAEELDKLDEIILMDIYPARELPIEGVTSKWLSTKMKNKNIKLTTKAELMDYLSGLKTEVLLTLGAGDIGTFVHEIERLYKEN